jgi:chitinase
MRLVVAWFVAVFLTAVSSTAFAAVYTCDQAGLTNALTAGGGATFSCAAATTVTVTATQNIAVDGTTLDGGGLLTISGGDTVATVVSVATGVKATIANLTIEHGTGTGYGKNLVVSGFLTLNDSIVQNGTMSGGTAIYVPGGGTLISNRSSVINNATHVEGAINVWGSATLNSTTVSGVPVRGVTTRGGGVLTVNNSTIVTQGNEPLLSFDASDSITVGSSLIISPGAIIPSADGAGTFVSTGYNMFNSTTKTPAATGDENGITPVLSPLALNGGTTPTHAFAACSPGINAGATTGGPATDQRGQPRIQNGAMDIGAFESTLLPCVYIDDASIDEGNTGTKPLDFNVRLSGPSTLSVSVPFTFADVSATMGQDYTATNGTTTFVPGATTGTVTAQIIGDTTFENDETFTVTLGVAVNASIGDGIATGTILNDDQPVPGISIANVTTPEGNAGPHPVDVTVTLTPAPNGSVSVDWATVDGTATAADNDFTAASGTLQFQAGETSKKISITVNGDLKPELDETFSIHLTNAVGATIAIADATVTLTNDDALPSISVADVTASEGTNAGFVVTLSAASTTTVAVHYTTADGTATAASGDYTPVTSDLIFSPGETTHTINVAVLADNITEPDETFKLLLSNPDGATLAATDATCTIKNDDSVHPDAGTDAGTDAGGSTSSNGGQGDAGAPNTGTADGGNTGIGGSNLNLGNGSGGSSNDCAVGAVGFEAGDGLALAGPLGFLIMALRRRRRRRTTS